MLTPKQLDWCRRHLRYGNIEIFNIMEADPVRRARA